MLYLYYVLSPHAIQCDTLFDVQFDVNLWSIGHKATTGNSLIVYRANITHTQREYERTIWTININTFWIHVAIQASEWKRESKKERVGNFLIFSSLLFWFLDTKTFAFVVCHLLSIVFDIAWGMWQSVFLGNFLFSKISSLWTMEIQVQCLWLVINEVFVSKTVLLSDYQPMWSKTN